MRVRPETAADEAGIADVIERAYASERFGSHTEQFIVRAFAVPQGEVAHDPRMRFIHGTVVSGEVVLAETHV